MTKREFYSHISTLWLFIFILTSRNLETSPGWYSGFLFVAALAMFLAYSLSGLRWFRRRHVSTESWDVEAKRLFASGDKIGAITLVRNATGMGLKEAKDFVESFGQQCPRQDGANAETR